MTYQRLLKSQKDEVFQIITGAGFDTNKFMWFKRVTEAPNGYSEYDVDVIVHGKSLYKFVFDFIRTGPILTFSHYAIFSPGEDTINEERDPGSWEFQLKNFTDWIGYLIRELDTPNYWENLGKSKSLQSSVISSEKDDETFTDSEIEELTKILKTKIEEVRELKLQGKINEIQETYGIDQIEFLITELDKMNKRQWLHTALGVITSLAAANFDLAFLNGIWIGIQNASAALAGFVMNLPQLIG